jgi:homoserine kinase
VTIVSAPGSSANLGPGFDVLGLAVACPVRAANEPLGEDQVECGADHIARIAYEMAGGTGRIFFDFELPPSRGLGFSAAARAAGAVLAFLERGLDIAEAQKLGYRVVTELEGHGDNAAPAVFGGLHVIAGGENHRLQATLPGQLMLWVPELDTTPTDESRARMPTMVERADAVFNLGRLGLLIAACYESDPSLLRRATEDRLHQPARLAAAPETKLAVESALEAGAHAAWLSGSGPAVAIVVEPGTADEVAATLPSTGKVLCPDLDDRGAVEVRA